MGEEHGGDFVFLGEVSMLEHVREQIKERFLVTSANLILLVNGNKRQKHYPKRRVSVVNFGCHLEFDERDVRSVLDKSGMGQAKSAGERGSKEAMATAETCLDQILRYVQQARLPLNGWIVPGYGSNEVRYGIRNERNDAGRHEPLEPFL